jgi:GH25 family lysozyme M1 (1,4-beta-N-acetylmuramidase)
MKYILDNCPSPRAWELPFALDVEIDLQATNIYLKNDVGNFLTLLEQNFGRKPVIYSGNWWWQPNMSPPASWVGNYDFWLASYPYAAGRVDSTWEELPSHFPDGWNEDRWIAPVPNGRRPKIWQFSGDKFWLPGINGALDLNLFDGDEAALRQWAGLEPPPPVPPTLEERVVKLETEARTRGWEV